MTALAPARLHVLFANEAPVGVVFRRGPSKQVRLILWRTDTDTFEPGQWLNGRLYAEWASLSPNGKLLAYVAADHRARRPSPSYTWTAISRPPYLTALALWFPAWGYASDATFVDNHTVLIRGEVRPAAGKEPPRELVVAEQPSRW